MNSSDTPGTAGQVGGRDEPSGEQRAAAAAIGQMIWGLHISRAIYVAAELGIADHLAEAGPMTAVELAEATQAHEPSLYRILRLLASLGVLAENSPRVFSLTILGDRLRTDVPASVRSWALLLGTVALDAFGPIIDTVRTGRSGIAAWNRVARRASSYRCSKAFAP